MMLRYKYTKPNMPTVMPSMISACTRQQSECVTILEASFDKSRVHNPADGAQQEISTGWIIQSAQMTSNWGCSQVSWCNSQVALAASSLKNKSLVNCLWCSLITSAHEMRCTACHPLEDMPTWLWSGNGQAHLWNWMKYLLKLILIHSDETGTC